MTNFVTHKIILVKRVTCYCNRDYLTVALDDECPDCDVEYVPLRVPCSGVLHSAEHDPRPASVPESRASAGRNPEAEAA